MSAWVKVLMKRLIWIPRKQQPNIDQCIKKKTKCSNKLY